MGFTGELVRNVFSRNRSHETKVRRNSAENKRWVSVRSYLCGEEFNSVVAEEDSASVKSSEVTVTQPMQENFTDEDAKSEETVENITEEKPNSNSNNTLLNEEEAAIRIQSALRGFLLRRSQKEEIRSSGGKEELNIVTQSPDRKSTATSVEVQTGNSTEVFFVEGEKMSIYHRIQRRTRTHATKPKEEWDDSTVSSNVSKMRMQNRMEATTRRERALAYAFSQQLRICSKKRSPKFNNIEPNMSWSWLERWMATRLHDDSSVESHALKRYDSFNSNHSFTIKTRFLDAGAGEEKESCGSNEAPLHFDSYSVNSQDNGKGSFKTTKSKTNLKARRTVSRRKTVPSYQFHEEQPKVCKRDDTSNASNEIKQKTKASRKQDVNEV